MRCPRCGTEQNMRTGRCMKCGYEVRGGGSKSLQGMGDSLFGASSSPPGMGGSSPRPGNSLPGVSGPPTRPTGSLPRSGSPSLPGTSGSLPRPSGSLPRPGGSLPRSSGSLPRASGSLSGLTSAPAPYAKNITNYALSHGDHLNEGRYRLMGQITLPETQKRHGPAWMATDTLLSHRRVVVREMLVPRELARGSSVTQICSTIAQRLQTLGQHPGFPSVSDFFTERGSSFIVFQHPDGVSLASLLKRYGGALPEDQVAAYGYQICALLTLLADQQPPIVHGSINPETILIDEDKHVASLIHLPLFKPDTPSNNSGQVSAGYYAPEQVHGELSPATDLYGLAVTMHHMVTGYDPRTRLALFHPPARRLNPTVTPQMEMIIAQQLSLSASQRYAHPSEMQRDLAALIESYPAPAGQDTQSKGANPLQLSATELQERSRNTLLLNMGVFAAICVLLLVGILLVLLR